MREWMRLARLAGRYWLHLALAILLMAAVGASMGVLVLLFGAVIQTVLAPHANGHHKVMLLPHLPFFGRPLYLNTLLPGWISHNPASMVAIAMIVTIAFKGLCQYLGTYLVNYGGYGLVTDLRNHFYEKLIYKSASFFHKHSTPKLISTAINDINRIQTGLSNNLADALRQGFTLLFLVATILAINWQMSLVLLLAAPVVVIPSARIGRLVRRTTRRGLDELADVQHILHETLTGNRVVKAFNMEWREIQRFRDAAMRLLRQNLRYIQQQNLSSPLMEFFAVGLMALYVLYVRSLINHGYMTNGTAVAFFIALTQLYQPLRRLPGIYNHFQQALGSAQRVFEFMDARQDVVEREGARRLRGLRQSIRFDQVEFAYEGEEPLLRDINLEIARGQVLALVGASGAGKSTLANLLPRFFDVSGGRVLVDGVDVRDLTLRSLRDQIAYVAQDTILFNDTVAANIAYGAAAAGEARIQAAASAALAHDFILALPQGYATRLGERGLRLSGGERQRIAIARALLKNAPILILDEATSALDTESEMLVQRALGNLMLNRTVLVIAHRLATIRRADCIVVLEKGRIVEQGTHDELLASSGRYRQLYDLQFADSEDTALPVSTLAPEPAPPIA